MKEKNPLTTGELISYFVGLGVMFLLFIISFFIGETLTPLVLLQARLLLLVIGCLYFFSVFLFFDLSSKNTRNIIQESLDDIIIIINGKEIRL